MSAINRDADFESVIHILGSAKGNPAVGALLLGQVREAMAPLARQERVSDKFVLDGRSLGELAAQMDAGQIERFVGELPIIADAVAGSSAGMAGLVTRALGKLAKASAHGGGIPGIEVTVKREWRDDGDRRPSSTVTFHR